MFTSFTIIPITLDYMLFIFFNNTKKDAVYFDVAVVLLPGIEAVDIHIDR